MDLELLAVDENGSVWHIPVTITAFRELKLTTGEDATHWPGDPACAITKAAEQKKAIQAESRGLRARTLRRHDPDEG